MYLTKEIKEEIFANTEKKQTQEKQKVKCCLLSELAPN
jgi:hypothetical protein